MTRPTVGAPMPGHDEEREWASQLISQCQFWQDRTLELQEVIRGALMLMPEGEAADVLRAVLPPDDDGSGWVTYAPLPERD